MTMSIRLRSGPVLRSIALRSAIGTVTASIALSAPLAATAAAETTTVLTGDTNTAAAIAWSNLTYSPGSAPTVLIARDDDFADALASGATQGLLDAPLLLTNSEVLSPDTAAELERLGAREAFIVGGAEAVSPTVETSLETLGITATRIMGATRLETAIAMVETFFPNATTFVVARAFETDEPTQAFADALAAGAFSAGTNIPILLTETNTLSAPTQAYLADSAAERAIIAGGRAAVGAEVETALAADLGDDNVTRASGSERTGTAVALNAEQGFTTATDADRVLLVEGQGGDAWASGLPAGAQAINGAATVLALGGTVPQPTLDFLEGSNGAVGLVCGPKVDPQACATASEALGNE